MAETVTKGDQTRQRIIEQSAPLFNQRGFAGCSMQDIMQATGLEKGGLYRHFTSKEELAAEAFRYASARSIARRMAIVEQTEGSVAKLRALVHAFVHVPSQIPGGCVLMNTAIDADDTNPTLRQLAYDSIQRWKSLLIRVVEEGIETGEVRPETEPRRIANTLIATLEGALMISRLEGDRKALEDVEVVLNGVLDGIAAPI
ncbi:transcriptional regulator, TetR family [Granulicella rosea]|uniref:Transcriptional regulator, TetR family n=1 Tax=Granulicella rosea TaxID=474952 RepID=A0A239D1S2_9BACT|nr:TetR/AcrR family transcriptional regulator [Granulicella rosea]SNS25978.1 transcriptional regulator, TetR family [Granulicella rosea]